jgi:hypothetical protein
MATVTVCDFETQNPSVSIFVNEIELSDSRYQEVLKFNGSLYLDIQNSRTEKAFSVHFEYQHGSEPVVTADPRRGCGPSSYLLNHLSELVEEFVRTNRRYLKSNTDYLLQENQSYTSSIAQQLNDMRDGISIIDINDAGWLTLKFQDFVGKVRMLPSGKIIRREACLFAIKERAGIEHCGPIADEAKDKFLAGIGLSLEAIESQELQAIA